MNPVKAFINNLIELLNTALLQPEELSLALEHDKRSNLSIVVLLGIVSLGNVVAIYQMRGSYDRGFLFFITAGFMISFLFLSMTALLVGSLMNSFVKFFHPEKQIPAWQSIQFSALAFMPFLFLLPVSVPASYFSFQFLFLFFCVFLLIIWTLYILTSATRYLYELQTREAFIIIFASMLLVFVFPMLFMFFGTMEIALIIAG